MTCAISAPVMPGMALSVTTKSWFVGLNRASASSAFRTESTAYPKLVRNHFVVTRQSSESSRSEEHTSELQSRQYFVCRLLIEKTGMGCRKRYGEYVIACSSVRFYRPLFK